MSEPSEKKAKGAGVSRKVQTIGLVATLAAVGVLVGSLAFGLDGTGSPAPVVAVDGAPGPVVEPAAGRVRVEVLNASGRTGLARVATRHLRDRGFDVVSFGNASGRAGQPSQVIDRVGKRAAAGDVAEALGIGRVTEEPDSSVMVDATVVLGKDWAPERILPPDPAAPVAPDSVAADSAAG